MENYTGCFLKQDKQLFNGLLQHLRPAIYRLIHHIEIKNPLIEEIKASYKGIFNQVKNSVNFIEEKYLKEFSDEEVGYLTLHFQAAIENNKDKDIKKPEVLVVCATGIGTSKMVSVRIQALFDVNIVDTISYREVQKALLKHSVDVIVTTVPLKIKGISCVQVSPFLSEKNISELSLVFSKLYGNNLGSNRFKNKESINIDEIIDIIKDNGIIDNEEKLKSHLKDYLELGVRKNSINSKPELNDILKKQCIALNAEAENWEEAVRLSGKLLLQNNYIKESYIDAMIKTVNEMGPYIVILPGIAMPHARPEDGVKAIGASVVTLKNPIYFGNSENDPVKVVIAICSTDHISHMKALSQLMKVIESPKFLENILKIQTPKECMDYIQNIVVSIGK